MFHKLKNLLIIICILTAGLFAAHFALAQDAGNLLFGGLQNETQGALGLGNTNDPPQVIIARIIRIIIGFLGIIAVGLVIYAGFLWMTSEGEADKVERAKRTLRNAVIGLIIILSSFAIATFVLNKLLGAATGGGLGPGTQPPGAPTGFGAIGSCSVESVYPEPNQEDVPRNISAIMVTFREEVAPETVCGANPCNGDPIEPGSVRLYQSNQEELCNEDENSGCITGVTATSLDNFTYVFSPDSWLGSPSENIWYSVYLTNEILKVDSGGGLGEGIFSSCRNDYLEWQFEVSNIVDLTPPQVRNGGVFPRPDSAADVSGEVEAAVQAEGDITVTGQPDVYAPAQVTDVRVIAGPNVNIDINPNNTISGTLIATVLPDGSTVQLSMGGTLLGAEAFNGNSVSFPEFFTLTASGSHDPGNEWEVDVTSMVSADTLTVGSTIYTFVSGAPGTNEIQRNGINGTAANIAAVLDGRADLIAAVTGGDNAHLTAQVAGAAGNNIVLAASNETALAITAMSGGRNRTESTTINGLEDQPMNSVIQINFNEAINPLAISGDAEALQDYIAVKCIPSAGNDCNGVDTFDCDGERCVHGTFTPSNQYKTVEFISDYQCGVNSCGENIYCLPENSNLRVDLVAADFVSCPGILDCSRTSPYSTCVGNVCQNLAGENYPLSNPLSGISDTAANSLDGNRNELAQGPASFYNENTGGAGGDNFQWSFFISGEIDLNPPVIVSFSSQHEQGDTNVSLTDPVEINFNKLMMSGSLKTGSRIVTSEGGTLVHKNINIWNFTGRPPGYWITNEGVDTSAPPDLNPEFTRAYINHSMFSDATSYRSQVGSGVRDIYQNCFTPSTGPNCAPTAAEPSCCGEVETPGSECP